jgi:hypothetical protein
LNETEWKGMEKPIDIFGIKTMFTGFSQSSVSSAYLFSMEWNRIEWKNR